MMNVSNFIKKPKKLEIFYEHFMRQEGRTNDIFFDNTCLHSHKLNIAQKVTENVSEFSNSKMQVFYMDIDDQYFNTDLHEILQKEKRKMTNFKEGTKYPVECIVFDLRLLIFYYKLQKIRAMHQ